MSGKRAKKLRREQAEPKRDRRGKFTSTRTGRDGGYPNESFLFVMPGRDIPKVWDDLHSKAPQPLDPEIARGVHKPMVAFMAKKGIGGGQEWADIATPMHTEVAIRQATEVFGLPDRIGVPQSQWYERPDQWMSAVMHVGDALAAIGGYKELTFGEWEIAA